MTLPIQLTSANAWKPQTWRTALPSGKVVELKKPSVFALIADDGSIPDTAFEMFTQKPNGKTEETPEQAAKSMREQMRVMLSMARVVVPNAVVSLRVITDGEPDYESGEIHLHDMDEQDQMFLVTWGLQGGEPEVALARFLEQQQGASVPATQNMPSVLPASVRADGDREPAHSV